MEKKLNDTLYFIVPEQRINGNVENVQIITTKISAIRNDGAFIIDLTTAPTTYFGQWINPIEEGVTIFRKKEDAVQSILENKKKEFDNLGKHLLEEHPEPTKRMVANFRINLLP